MPSAKWWLCLGALLGLSLLRVHAAGAKTSEWREEVALQDGGMIVLSWWVQLVPGCAPIWQLAASGRWSWNPGSALSPAFHSPVPTRT
jgi:hypothetical protein